jgi:caa(3)-type oxidase subunit IV
MSDHDHDIKSHIRTYMIIGAALFIGTILTVAVSYVDFGSHAINVAVGLIIATVKASLVALFFMHLIDDKTAIYLLLSCAFFFFVGLMGLTIWADQNPPNKTRNLQHDPMVEVTNDSQHPSTAPDSHSEPAHH